MMMHGLANFKRILKVCCLTRPDWNKSIALLHLCSIPTNALW